MLIYAAMCVNSTSRLDTLLHHGDRSLRCLGGLLILLTLSSLAVASEPARCPLPTESRLDPRAFHPAFASPKSADDLSLRARVNPQGESPAVEACWKLTELQAHQSYVSLDQPSPASPGEQQARNSCGGSGERWALSTYWLTPAELQREQSDCDGLRRELLRSCLTLVAPGQACTVEKEKPNQLDGSLRDQLKTLCEVEKDGAEGCKELLNALAPKPAEPPASRRTRLSLAGVALGVGALSLALGITHLFVPLGISGSCPQDGLNYPCAPDRLGLGVPLIVTGGLFAVAGGVLLAVKF